MYYWFAGIGGGIVLLTYILGYFWGVYTERTIKPIVEGWGGMPAWLLWVALVGSSVVYINIVTLAELNFEMSIMWYVASGVFFLGAVSWVPTLRHHQSTGQELPMQLSLNATAAGAIAWMLLAITLVIRKPSPQFIPQVIAASISAGHHTFYDAFYWFNEYLDDMIVPN